MFVAPGAKPPFGYTLTRDAAQQIARNWWLLLLNGALLIVAGVLIFSIDWTIRELATFIGVLFIVQGIASAHHRDRRPRAADQRDHRAALDRDRHRRSSRGPRPGCSPSPSSSAPG